MNKVLVDNAILGPWIYVGSRMQLLSAAKSGDELTARAGNRQLPTSYPGWLVAVIGCGEVRLAAIQGARLAGASPIIAVDRVGVEARPRSRAARPTWSTLPRPTRCRPCAPSRSGRGADHAIEVVGRSATIRQAFDMTRRAGTVTIVGAGSFTDMVEFGAMQLMVDAKTVRGCVYGSTDPAMNFPEMIRLHLAGRLDLDGGW